MRDFRKLNFWKESFEFGYKRYLLTSDFPKEEKYGVTDQLRRASLSISANIAEGCGRETKKELIRFLYISTGSLKKCENFLLMSNRLGYISNVILDNSLIETENIAKQIMGYIRWLKKQ